MRERVSEEFEERKGCMGIEAQRYRCECVRERERERAERAERAEKGNDIVMNSILNSILCVVNYQAMQQLLG